jgi:hypothetical protein
VIFEVYDCKFYVRDHKTQGRRGDKVVAWVQTETTNGVAVVIIDVCVCSFPCSYSRTWKCEANIRFTFSHSRLCIDVSFMHVSRLKVPMQQLQRQQPINLHPPNPSRQQHRCLRLVMAPLNSQCPSHLRWRYHSSPPQ